MGRPREVRARGAFSIVRRPAAIYRRCLVLILQVAAGRHAVGSRFDQRSARVPGWPLGVRVQPEVFTEVVQLQRMRNRACDASCRESWAVLHTILEETKRAVVEVKKDAQTITAIAKERGIIVFVTSSALSVTHKLAIHETNEPGVHARGFGIQAHRSRPNLDTPSQTS